MSLFQKFKSLIFPQNKPTVCISRLPHANLAFEISTNNHLRREQERQKKLDEEYEKLMKHIAKRIRECTYKQIIVSVPYHLAERVGNSIRLNGYTFEHKESRSDRPMYRISWKHKV